MRLLYNKPTQEQYKYILTDILKIDNLLDFSVKGETIYYTLEDFGSLEDYSLEINNKGLQRSDKNITDEQVEQVDKYLLAIGYHYLLEDNEFVNKV